MGGDVTESRWNPPNPFTEDFVAKYQAGDKLHYIGRVPRNIEIVSVTPDGRYYKVILHHDGGRTGVKASRLVDNETEWQLNSGPTYNTQLNKSPTPRPMRFLPGQVVVNGDGSVSYQILGVAPQDPTSYEVHILKSRTPGRAGMTVYKQTKLVDRDYRLASSSRVAAMKLPDIDIDGEILMAGCLEHVCTIMRKSICDCGGHKLGYKDDELHGHGTWCKLVELSQGVKRAQ